MESEIIEVLGKPVTKIEYLGHRVVTLRQIDEAHEKAADQARRQFNRNRTRFEEGRDFFAVPYAELLGQIDPIMVTAKGGRRGPINVFTERGYGKIVKGWNDDLSWRLHDAMQDAYFLVKEAMAAADAKMAPEIDYNVMKAIFADFTNQAMRNFNEAGKKMPGDIIGGLTTNLGKRITEAAQITFERVGRSLDRRETEFKSHEVEFAKGQKRLHDEVEKLNRRFKVVNADRVYVRGDWLDPSMVYEKYFPGVAIPKRGLISRWMSRSLDSYCKRHERPYDMDQVQMGGRWHNVWHIDSIEIWMERWGRDAIQALIDKHKKP